MNKNKPTAILVSSFFPFPGWGGSSMRAWDWLKTLSRDYRVQLIVTTNFDYIPPSIDENYPAERIWNIPDIRFQKRKIWERKLKWPFLTKHNPRHIQDMICIDQDKPFQEALTTSLHEADIRRVIIFKLQNHEFGKWFAKTFPNATVELDMDDYESHSRQSISQAFMRLGRKREGKRLLRQALQYRILEEYIAGPYQYLYLANSDDCHNISTRLANRIEYRPNRIAFPDTFPEPPTEGINLLFVGTLSYLPNEEAIYFLINKLLPELRQKWDGHWHLTIAGRTPSDEIRKLCQNDPAVTLLNDVATLIPLYKQTHIALIPLFSGSGTKLKSLEAIGYRRPIISTSEGVRGLNLENGKHYLHAETAAEFANAIQKLATDTPLARRIGQTAYEYTRRTFSIPS